MGTTHRPLWWTYRHFNEDDFTQAVWAIVDANVADAENEAAARALEVGCTNQQAVVYAKTAYHTATRRYEQEATEAIEQYVTARKIHAAGQRNKHIRLHGCHPNCVLLRGPR